MGRVFLVHWNPAEARERAAKLRAWGHRVRTEAKDGARAVRVLRDRPSQVVVVDLSRVPSHGEAVGIALAAQKATRSLPLVFVGGAAEKVARTRRLLPHATFVSWRGLRGAVSRALARPPRPAPSPSSRLVAYTHVPLSKKLGLREGVRLALVGAPDGFEETLGDVPAGVRLRRGARATADLTLWFVRTRRELLSRIDGMTTRGAGGGLWIVWPKRASASGSDLTQAIVRKAGLDAGLVDFKVCRIDDTWAGLRFTRRP